MPIYRVKWGLFDRVKPTFKMLLPFWKFYKILNELRPLNAENLKSIGQRTTKIPAIKLWEWFDPELTRMRADWFEWGWGWAVDFFLRPQTLAANNFKALWSKDLKFLALKDLKPLQKHKKNQEASCNFWLGFTLSNRPHFAS